MRNVLIAAVVVGAMMGAGAGRAQKPFDEIKNQAELDAVMKDLDTQLFDAYNRCDLDKFASFVDDNIEFYHDNGGVTLGKAAFVDSVRKNICPTDTHRVPVPGTLEAHYMKGYGFIEIGVHRFEHPKTHDRTGQGQFVTLWHYTDGAWKMTRCLSFDHKLAPEEAK